jgi:hypothetical protein
LGTDSAARHAALVKRGAKLRGDPGDWHFSRRVPSGGHSARRETGRAQVIEINLEPTDLTSEVSDFLIQEKAGVAIPQIIAAIRAMAS